MRIGSFAAAVKISVMLLLAQGAPAAGAEIKLLSGLPIRPVINELRPEFERTTGHKLVIRFELSSALKREVEAGETFDVAIFEPAQIDDLIKQDKIIAGTRADIARAGIGVGARAGAPKSDISSLEAFKRTLLDAKSVAYVPEGSSGKSFVGLLERLGIAADMKAKLRPKGAGGAVLSSVANGEAELAVSTVPTIVAAPGVELVGSLPIELQTYISFTAGVGTSAKEAEAAQVLIRFLTSPAAIAVIKAKGMEPGASQ